ncbi:MAG: response regulator [Anaerolinea sp.]|nr:response regulator [Anaerolinea sp.]
MLTASLHDNWVFSNREPYSVYTAANGHLGVQLFQQEWPSIRLILLDINMPVMNGEQTYKKLQQIAPDVKVIVSSSLS